MNAVSKPCTHGHTLRRKCGTCDREDDQELIADLTKQVQRLQRDADRFSIVRDKCAVWEGVFRLPPLDKYQLAKGPLISGGQRLEAAIDAYLADDEAP